MKEYIKKIVFSFLFFVCCLPLYGKGYNVDKKEILFQAKVVSLELTGNDEEAEKLYTLLSGTLAIETRLGSHKKNKLGVAQITRVAYKEIIKKLKEKKYKKLLNKANVIYGSNVLKLDYHRLQKDYRAEILFAALYYEVVGVDYSKINSKHDAAKAWKKFYNTSKGKGTVKGFLLAYEEELE